jgi:hypothetical protein
MRRFLLCLILPMAQAGTLHAQFLINENFEGTGTPSGWNNSAGTPDYDYSVSPLYGLQSLLCNSSAQSRNGTSLNDAEVWLKCSFRLDGTMPGFNYLLRFLNSSDIEMLDIAFLSGPLYVFDGVSGGTGQTVDSVTSGTVYDLWVHYKKGTGADAILEASFDVTGNPRPNTGNKYVVVANGAGTANAVKLDLFGSATDVVFDNVQVCNTDCFAAGPTPTPTATATATPAATTVTNGNWFFFLP